MEINGNKLKKIMILDGYSTGTLACVRSFGKNISFTVGGGSSKLGLENLPSA